MIPYIYLADHFFRYLKHSCEVNNMHMTSREDTTIISVLLDKYIFIKSFLYFQILRKTSWNFRKYLHCDVIIYTFSLSFPLINRGLSKKKKLLQFYGMPYTYTFLNTNFVFFAQCVYCEFS